MLIQVFSLNSVIKQLNLNNNQQINQGDTFGLRALESEWLEKANELILAWQQASLWECGISGATTKHY